MRAFFRIFVQEMQYFKSIASLILAALVLASSTTFSVGLHVCRGHVHNIAVMQKAQPCGMELMAAELGFADEDCALAGGMKCCEDRTLSFEGTEYQYKTPTTVVLPDVTTVSAVMPSLLSQIAPLPSSVFQSHDSYKPPLLHRDVTVLVQSFLI